MSELMFKLANGTITDEEMIELRNIERWTSEETQGFLQLKEKLKRGLMDLGGMEKDYRNDGGFVPSRWRRKS